MNADDAILAALEKGDDTEAARLAEEYVNSKSEDWREGYNEAVTEFVQAWAELATAVILAPDDEKLDKAVTAYAEWDNFMRQTFLRVAGFNSAEELREYMERNGLDTGNPA